MEKKSAVTAQEFNEERFTKVNVFKKDNSTMFVLNFMPGQKLPEHNHPGHELYLHVARGTGRFTVDDETSGVAEGDVIHIGSEEKISFENDGTEPASIYVTMTRLPKQH
ncbi:cupin domain-containing protein [Salinicoccus roseus]|jgi:quercetin dioxygenase-like cupin family protein|uniref:cupin domain-containing protein n=1 Tax=Salinicoccus roseus TaxID=45670 RepID=UPI000F4FB536|nr:cupin domain-containing protein [Salinicoccus roseus]RPE54637.1 quercetin dioxygenase-like cupin family protein [Salinicoccus roseus]GGA64022.1 hypothetical protein GCM10007176_05420 [Salinicoccus roseus]